MRLSCQVHDRYSGTAHASLVVSRKGLSWRRGLRGHDRSSWTQVTAWSVEPDRSYGVAPHTHALKVTHTGGKVWFRVRGPRGALALVRLRDRIRDRYPDAADTWQPAPQRVR